MSGVERDKHRVKQTAEVFTPTPLVQEMLDKLEEQDPTLFTDPNKTFLDNSCGDGQFLSEVIIRKIEKSTVCIETNYNSIQRKETNYHQWRRTYANTVRILFCSSIFEINCHWYYISS
jgi:hypothetical protein